MKNKIRVLIADDHPLIRKGLNALLQSEPDIILVGEAINGQEAVEKAKRLKPDVIILDLIMPIMNGIEATQEIMQDVPNTRILVLTSFSDDEMVFPAIKAGAMGYLLKDTAFQEVVNSIRYVYQGESSMHPTIARKLINEITQPEKSPAKKLLSERELDVLQFIARGLSNREIAAELVISDRTIAVHVQNILRKLHVANRTQATLIAIQEGYVEIDNLTDNK